MAGAKIKPHLNWTLFCDDVRQELGGKYSLMGLFEAIYAGSFPALHHRFAIINHWSGGKGEFSCKIRLLTPDREKVISESESTLVFFSETQHHRDISVRFNSLFPFPGTYWIETILDDEVISSIPFILQHVTDRNVH